MSDCSENHSPHQREEGPGAVGGRCSATTPDPSLPRRGIIFIADGEPKDHEVSAEDRLCPRHTESLPNFGRLHYHETMAVPSEDRQGPVIQTVGGGREAGGRQERRDEGNWALEWGCVETGGGCVVG
jgi:hypothetical protein